MRKEPLKLGKNAEFTLKGPRHIIKDLDLIEPFGYIECHDYKLYSTPSLMESSRSAGTYDLRDVRGPYIWKDFGTLRIFYRDENKFICFGKFFDLCSSEEQEKIIENLPMIMNTLGIKDK